MSGIAAHRVAGLLWYKASPVCGVRGSSRGVPVAPLCPSITPLASLRPFAQLSQERRWAPAKRVCKSGDSTSSLPRPFATCLSHISTKRWDHFFTSSVQGVPYGLLSLTQSSASEGLWLLHLSAQSGRPFLSRPLTCCHSAEEPR